MLILTRKCHESVIIDHHVKITVVGVKRGEVKLGISAPRRIGIYREEIYRRPAGGAHPDGISPAEK